METVVIKVAGMSCQGCVKSVTGALTAVPGVASAEVSLEQGEARVGFDPATASVAQLRQAVDDAGFDAA